MRSLWAFVLLSSALAQTAAGDTRVRATLAVEKTGHSTFQAEYSLTNVSGGSLRFAYSDGQQYDFVLSDQGRELWRWSADIASGQVSWEETLAPGASIVAVEAFSWPDDHETLLLEVYLTVSEDVRREETRVGLHLLPEDGRAGTEARRSDFDGSGVVDFLDFRVLEAAFGTSLGDPGFKEEVDLDGDGGIRFRRLLPVRILDRDHLGRPAGGRLRQLSGSFTPASTPKCSRPGSVRRRDRWEEIITEGWRMSSPL